MWMPITCQYRATQRVGQVKDGASGWSALESRVNAHQTRATMARAAQLYRCRTAARQSESSRWSRPRTDWLAWPEELAARAGMAAMLRSPV